MLGEVEKRNGGLKVRTKGVKGVKMVEMRGIYSQRNWASAKAPLSAFALAFGKDKT